MYDYRNMFNLDGRVALVAGAGSGIGQAAALGLASFGAYIYCADINPEGTAATVSQIEAAGGNAEAISLDIRNEAMINEVLADAKPIDILVSTPSINVRKPLLQITGDEFDRVMNLNMKGTFLLMTAVARRMADRGKGSIIIFSSIRSQVVEPGQGIYAATKSGAVQMVKALAVELADKGVRVNAIAPGVVETPLTQQIKNSPDWYNAYGSRNAMQRWAQPHEMVGAVVYLASDASSYVTGSLMFVDAGWTAIDGRFSPPL